MAVDPVTAIANVVSIGLDKFLPDKMSEQDRETLKRDVQFHLMEQAAKESGAFREFVVAYEGAAKDVPRVVVVFRSLIRPTFTILVGYFDWLYITASMAIFTPDAVSLLKAINIIVLGFWFGERALQRSGIMEVLKIRAEKKDECVE